MATIEEVYEQVVGSDEEKAAFSQAAQTPESLATFLSERGCEASAEELFEFLRGRQGELADDELDSVAGGCSMDETVLSACTAGVGCAVQAIKSSVKGKMKGDDGRILCAYTPTQLSSGQLS